VADIKKDAIKNPLFSRHGGIQLPRRLISAKSEERPTNPIDYGYKNGYNG